ncbi:MAG: Gfo/Idh/MocA family oxidoreductase [Chloroflexi bacterium]|nr:Gfo/Idh/MocA family oxidoreductase [Chloroflexota bacterium]
MLGIGVVGYGYWGPNLVRNFMEVDGSQVITVCDLRGERLAEAKRRYPSLHITREYRDLLDNPAIDAIAIATPVSTHFPLAMAALRAGKHVLVEKPLAASSEEAEQMIEAAEQRGLVLMVDHTFIYTGAVRKIKELIDNNSLGQLYYYDSVRINLGLFQHDINVLWDLAVHDLSIMDFIVQAQPSAVSCTGMAHVRNQPENVAYLTCFFDHNFIAHFHVNWLAPAKIRQTIIGGDRRMIVYDDLEPSEKVKVYDKGITLNGNPDSVYQLLVNYRSGDMWAPQLDRTEALRTEALHFIECVNTGQTPLTNGFVGARVVRILEAASQSLAQRGRPVELREGWLTQA